MRGHLAAQIDPIGLNNMDRDKAREMIIRSVTVDDKVQLDDYDPPMTVQLIRTWTLSSNCHKLHTLEGRTKLFH